MTFTQNLCSLVLQEFIEAIDAIDNGISQYPSDIKPLYRLRTDLSSRVGHLNPAWNQSVDAQAVDVTSDIIPSDMKAHPYLGALP